MIKLTLFLAFIITAILLTGCSLPGQCGCVSYKLHPGPIVNEEKAPCKSIVILPNNSCYSNETYVPAIQELNVGEWNSNRPRLTLTDE